MGEREGGGSVELTKIEASSFPLNYQHPFLPPPFFVAHLIPRPWRSHRSKLGRRQLSVSFVFFAALLQLFSCSGGQRSNTPFHPLPSPPLSSTAPLSINLSPSLFIIPEARTGVSMHVACLVVGCEESRKLTRAALSAAQLSPFLAPLPLSPPSLSTSNCRLREVVSGTRHLPPVIKAHEESSA